MKQINEYLNTKVKVNTPFPNEPMPEDITNFLLKNGFKELKFDNNKWYKKVFKANSNTRRFMSHEYEEGGIKNLWILFIEAGDVSEQNPMFSISYHNDEVYDMRTLCESPSGSGKSVTSYETYDEFVEAINSKFKF